MKNQGTFWHACATGKRSGAFRGAGAHHYRIISSRWSIMLIPISRNHVIFKEGVWCIYWPNVLWKETHTISLEVYEGRGCTSHPGFFSQRSRAPSQYPKRRLFVRSRKVSKPRDWYFKLSYRFEIWQAHRQHCCRSACQISNRSDKSKYKSRSFEIWRDLTERRIFGYWDGAQLRKAERFPEKSVV